MIRKTVTSVEGLSEDELCELATMAREFDDRFWPPEKDSQRVAVRIQQEEIDTTLGVCRAALKRQEEQRKAKAAEEVEAAVRLTAFLRGFGKGPKQ